MSYIFDSIFLTFYVKFLKPYETINIDEDSYIEQWVHLYPKQMLIAFCDFKGSNICRVRFNSNGHLCLLEWGKLQDPIKPNGRVESIFKKYFADKFEEMIL